MLLEHALEAAEARRVLRAAVGRLHHLARGPRRPAPPSLRGSKPRRVACHATRIQTTHAPDNVLMPTLPLISQALLRSQAGHAGDWLTAVPAESATALMPQAFHKPCRWRCGGAYDWRCHSAHQSEHARVRVGREAVDTEARSCKVVPQQWTAPDVQPQDRRRLDIMVYSNRADRHALMRCDVAILVSPLTRTW